MQRLRLKNPAHHNGDGAVPDGRGRLYDPAMRDTLSTFGRRTQVERLETLAALRLAANRVHTAMERWADEHGLSESRLKVLMALHHSPDGRLPLGQLADLLDVVPRTITDVVDVLQRDGLVRRTPDPDDRRSIHAQLTKQGRERVESISRDAVSRQTALFGGFDSVQMAELRHLCLLLVRGLSRAEGGS